MNPTFATKRKTFESINVLRGISVLLIILYHYTTRYSAKEEIRDLGLVVQWPFQVEWGCAAVVTFFMMSGFLIGGYFMNKKMNSQTYLLNRAFRLYPTFWCGVIITYGVLLLAFPEAAVSTKAFLYNFTMIPYFFHQSCVDGAYWTMQVEFFFSLGIGIILLFSNYKTRRASLLGWMVCVTLFYFIPDTYPLIKAVKFIFTPRYAHMFIAGISAYFILNKDYRPVPFILLTICCINQVLYSESTAHTIFFFTTLVVFLFTNQIDSAIRNSIVRPIVNLLTFFASISYSWYLIHQMIGYAIIKEFIEKGYYSEWLIIIPIVATMIVAVGLNKLVELPSARIGKKLSSRFLLSSVK